jgi:hypothetical protein
VPSDIPFAASGTRQGLLLLQFSDQKEIAVAIIAGDLAAEVEAAPQNLHDRLLISVLMARIDAAL